MFKQICSVALIKQERLENAPHFLVTPMLTENVSQIKLTRKVVNGGKLCCNHLMNMMKGQCIVALMQLGMRNGRTVNHRLIVTKDVTLVPNWYTKVAKSGAKIDDLINTNVCSNELLTIGSSLDSGLLLIVPVNWSLIKEMQNSHNQMSHNHIMIQVSIIIMCECNWLTKWDGCI